MRTPFSRCSGFTLVETLVATAIAVTAVVALAHLIAIGARQSSANRRLFAAAVAAHSKLEELRAVSWTFGGVPPPSLLPSPPRSLLDSIDGYADIVPSGVRRWAVSPFAPGDDDTVLLQVCVFRDAVSRPPDACVATVRRRKP